MKKSPLGTPTGPILVPENSDVLFGRGGHVNHHPANQRYLELVTERKEQYHNCKKVDKANIAWDIIRELREQNPPPRFLRKDYKTGLWHIVTDSEVRRKISQCLRERATPVINSAKKKSRRKAGARNIKPSPLVKLPKDMIDSDAEEISSQGPAKCLSRRTQEEVRKEEAASLPPLVLNEGKKTVEWSLQNEDQDMVQDEGFAPPPMPAAQPLSKTSSSRVWSDFLTGSFASFTPSIIDAAAAGAENAWENLLDPATLLRPGNADMEKDDRNPPQACLMSDAEEESTCCPGNEAVQASLSYSDNSYEHEIPKTSPPRNQGSTANGARAESISIDSFFNCEITSIGKVLEQSRFLTGV